MLLEPLGELLVGDLLDHRPHLGVAELGLGLALELRVAQLHREDRGEALADVLAEEVVLLLLQDVLAAAVLVHHVGEGLLEALLVHPALGGRDVVRERVDALVVAGVPLQRDVDLGVVGAVLERDHALEDRLLRRVEVPDEVGDAAGELERLLDRSPPARSSRKRISRPLLRNAISRSRSSSVCARNSVSSKTVGSGQNVTIVPVRFDGGLLLELALRLAALGEAHLPLAAVAVDLEVEPARQRVHDRHADAVEPAGDLVALAAELAAGVEHGEHDLGRRLVLVVGVVVDRDAAAVVVHPAPAVGEQGHVDPGGVAGHGLVDRVVDHLVDQMVQTGQTGRSDVHPGALADGLEALEHGDVLCAVCHSRRTSRGSVRRRVEIGWSGAGAGPASGGPRAPSEPVGRGPIRGPADESRTVPRTRASRARKSWSDGLFRALTVYHGPVTVDRASRRRIQAGSPPPSDHSSGSVAGPVAGRRRRAARR